MMVAGSLAGFISGILAAERLAKQEPSFKAASVRTGFTAALIAAALLVLRATWLYGSAGHVAATAFLTLFIAAVSILPATLFAIFMSDLGRAARLALQADPESGRPAFSFQPVHGVYAVCLLALLSPFVPGFLPEPRPPTVTSAPTPMAAEIVPPLPAFSYRIPDGFATAPTTRLAVVDEKPLPEVDTTKPTLFSPDSHRLAFHRESGASQILVIFDLNTFTETARIEFDAPAHSLVWSPDNKRLAGIFGTGEARYLGVVIPEQCRLIRLPRPEGAGIPEGVISWPDASEVILHPESGKPLALNLDTLAWRPLEDSVFFKTLDDWRKERVKKAPTFEFPKTAKWTMSDGWTLQSARPSFSANASLFKTSGVIGIIASDTERGVRHHLREFVLGGGNRVLFAPNGTKALSIGQQAVSVKYLGLRDAPKVVRRLDMKKKLEDFPQADALKKALSEKTLCAFVYPPLSNPLNNKVVGAEYTVPNAPKALVRFLSWSDTRAEVWMQDEFVPVEPTDIVCALHTWEERAPKPIAAENAFAWWTAIGNDGDTALDSVPLAQHTPAIDLWPQQITSTDESSRRPPLAAVSPQPQRSTFAPSPEQPPTPIAIPESSIAAFIINHHQKGSNRDIAGLMNDYADQVEHYKAGIVDRAHIQRKEQEYRAPGYTVLERVGGLIRQTVLSPERVRAEYPLRFVRVNPDTSWVKGVADVTLEIQMTSSGLRITKQNSFSREKEKQKGRGALPPL